MYSVSRKLFHLKTILDNSKIYFSTSKNKQHIINIDTLMTIPRLG